MLLASLSSALVAAQSYAPRVEPGTAATFERVAVVGAEISDGLGLDVDLGVPGSLADVVEAALRAPHEPVMRATSPAFANEPAATAARQLAEVGSRKPTLIVALDYALWFACAPAASDAERLARFDGGLKLLEAFACPILIGDLPEMASRLRVDRPNALVPPEPLAPSARRELEKRLEAWSLARENVVLAPCALVYARIASLEPFSVRDATWFRIWLPELLQRDLVHPRLDGTIALWLVGVGALVETHPEADPRLVEWDPRVLFKKVYDAKEGLRQAALDLELARLAEARPRPPPPPSPEEQRRRAEAEIREKNARRPGDGKR